MPGSVLKCEERAVTVSECDQAQNAGTQRFSSRQPAADPAAWADPSAFLPVIGQKSSSSGIGPQLLSKYRQLLKSNSCSTCQL